MNKILPTVTVGIPAYNEAANIKYLLEDILSQHEDSFFLEKIIVNSDGSDDDTVALARSIGDRRIQVIDDRKRKGQAARQNEIIRQTETDILVLLNADIILDGRSFLKGMIKPLIEGEAEFTSSNMLAVEPRTVVEKMLSVSIEFKNRIFEHWKDGKNLYTCHGAARAFSRAYYEHFSFEESVGEDAYSYFFGMEHGHRYAYVPGAVARIKLPGTLADHFKQSGRFFNSQTRFIKEFGLATIEREYALPKMLLLRSGMDSLLNHPILFSAYVIITFVSQWRAVFQKPIGQTWEIATSSKQLHL